MLDFYQFHNMYDLMKNHRFSVNIIDYRFHQLIMPGLLGQLMVSN